MSGEWVANALGSSIGRRWLDRIGLIVCLSMGIVLGLGFAVSDYRPLDADIFWRAGHAAHYYGAVWGANADSLYVYPPPLAQVLGLFDWRPFVAVWIPLVFLALWAATRWWSLPVVVVSVVVALGAGLGHPVANPFTVAAIGNTQWIVAASIVLGFRWPAAWGFVVLTKIGPGIGLLWFAVRREWRSLGIALLSTGIVAGFSLLLAPRAWGDFLAFAIANAGTTPPNEVVAVPLPLRLAMSALLIIWGARSNRRWTVVIAAGWASLALYESTLVTVWIAALVLTRSPEGESDRTRAPAAKVRSPEPLAAGGSAHEAPGSP